MNSGFVYSVTGGTITMVWPCKKNEQNKDTKNDITIRYARKEPMGR